MPRQNRVTPYGELIAVPDRGLFWGNRGALLDRRGEIARHSRGRAWLICVLSVKGRRRRQWQAGRATEVFFLGEGAGAVRSHGIRAAGPGSSACCRSRDGGGVNGSPAG